MPNAARTVLGLAAPLSGRNGLEYVHGTPMLAWPTSALSAQRYEKKLQHSSSFLSLVHPSTSGPIVIRGVICFVSLHVRASSNNMHLTGSRSCTLDHCDDFYATLGGRPARPSLAISSCLHRRSQADLLPWHIVGVAVTGWCNRSRVAPPSQWGSVMLWPWSSRHFPWRQLPLRWCTGDQPRRLTGGRTCREQTWCGTFPRCVVGGTRAALQLHARPLLHTRPQLHTRPPPRQSLGRPD